MVGMAMEATVLVVGDMWTTLTTTELNTRYIYSLNKNKQEIFSLNVFTPT